MSILASPSESMRWISFALFGLAFYATALSRLKRWVLQIKLDGKFDRALRADRLARLVPGYGNPLEGAILFSSGRYRQAQEYLRPRAFDEQGKPRLRSRDFYLYTLALVNDAREAEARPLLEEAIRIPQQTGSLHVALATCLLSMEIEPERARELLEHAMAPRPAFAQTYLQRADEMRRIGRYAWALAACGRRTEAEAKLQEALAGSAGFKDHDLGGVKYYVGETWRVLGEKAKARAAFDEALSLCPEGAVATSVGRAMTKLRSL